MLSSLCNTNLRLRCNQLVNRIPNTDPIVLDDIDPTSKWVEESHLTDFGLDDLGWMALDGEPLVTPDMAYTSHASATIADVLEESNVFEPKEHDDIDEDEDPILSNDDPIDACLTLTSCNPLGTPNVLENGPHVENFNFGQLHYLCFHSRGFWWSSCAAYLLLPGRVSLGTMDLDLVSAQDRIKQHIEVADNNPLLIFPEGTCVNNQYTVMFKKGAFELGCTVCPIAIKYNKIFVDAFWNSKKQSFTMHLVRLMTSWAVVCDVWYLEPQTLQHGETPIEFAERVRDIIATRAGIKKVPWDGYLKYYRPSPKLTET
ncbi:hypothetical protein KI387_034657, partial [Taxus chinensis]